MAVTQISRIQHRRGLEQDLPQLSSAELGWSVDTRQLYIGNGTLAEGAPIVGVTRILTEHDVTDITSNVAFTSYTFIGNAAGYTAQTGSSALSPTVRTYQQKLDDSVNVRDFGAVGDGTTDDTSALNRAIQQIYKSTVSPTEPRARRTIYFPGGTYLTSDTVLIPTYARLVGDGLSSTIIKQVNGNRSVANICDSSFQSGLDIGTNSAVLPTGIELNGINFFNSNSNIAQPILVIDSASNLKINSCTFYANNQPGFYPNLVAILSTNSATSKITFDSCQFTGGGNGLALIGSSVNSIRVFNSGFDSQANVSTHLGSSVGFVGIGNFIDSNKSPLFFGNNRNISLNDGTSSVLTAGLFLGNFQHSVSQQYTVSSTPLVIQLISNSAVKINYEIRNDVNARFGEFSYTSTNTGVQFNDDYIETGTSVNANVFANSDSYITSVSSGTATLKFNFTRFV
jgi:hypothetical protein